MNDSRNDYSRAITDFQNARRRADMQQLFAQLRGNSAHLFSYDDIRKKLKAVETGQIQRREIPLDAIVGSVGRYNDFTRDFLPRLDSDASRWAGVKTEVLGMTGVPPIEVYQIDQAYFVRDGNHRVSIARQMNLSTIEAYVTKVQTKVPLTPDVSLDELIIKSEYADFLLETDLKLYFPEAELEVTAPGRYDKFLEHIQLHQYYMGLNLKRDISYKEAVQDWYSNIYLPTVALIKDNELLTGFEGRTEADLYLWMANWHQQLEKRLGWKLDTDSVAEGLRDELKLLPESSNLKSKQEKFLDANQANKLFANVMVAVTGTEKAWQAVDQAIILAKLEGAKLYGLHGVGLNPDDTLFSVKKLIRKTFLTRCKDAGVDAQFAFVKGDVATAIAERSRWMDLVIAPLNHPPQSYAPQGYLSQASIAKGFLLTRLEGYEKLLRESYRPVLSVPIRESASLSQFKKPLFAFDGTPSNLVALSVVAYISKAWQVPIKMIHITDDTSKNTLNSTINSTLNNTIKNVIKKEDFQEAQAYLESRNVDFESELVTGDVVETIAAYIANDKHDVIITGSYAYGRWLVRIMRGVLNELLQVADVPILVVK